MDKGDIWLPQKIAPMPGQIPGAEADAFNHRRLLTPGYKLTILATREVVTSWFQLPGKKDCLFCHLMRGWAVICRLIIEKEKKM